MARKTSKRSAPKKSKSRQVPCVDLTSFGFSAKKRPAPADVAAGRGTCAGGADARDPVTPAKKSSSSDVEVVSVTKRASTPFGRKNATTNGCGRTPRAALVDLTRGGANGTPARKKRASAPAPKGAREARETPIAIFEDAPAKAEDAARPPPRAVVAERSPRKKAKRTSLGRSIQSYFSEAARPGESPGSGHPEGPRAVPTWLAVGRLVRVARRMWAGMNSPGGLGRVERLYWSPKAADGRGAMVVDVKYLPNEPKTRDRGIALAHVTEHAAFELERTRGGGGRTLPAEGTEHLGLMRVADPHEISCRTAVAQARALLLNPDDDTVLHADASCPSAWRVRPGHILGRPSSTNPRDFLDLGFGRAAAGISREHVRILAARAPAAGAPATLSIQCHEKATNGVEVHRTRRGKRGGRYLTQGERLTLRVGDALVFYSEPRHSFCVVGLAYAPDPADQRRADEAPGAGGEGEGAAHAPEISLSPETEADAASEREDAEETDRTGEREDENDADVEGAGPKTASATEPRSPMAARSRRLVSDVDSSPVSAAGETPLQPSEKREADVTMEFVEEPLTDSCNGGSEEDFESKECGLKSPNAEKSKDQSQQEKIDIFIEKGDAVKVMGSKQEKERKKVIDEVPSDEAKVEKRAKHVRGKAEQTLLVADIDRRTRCSSKKASSIKEQVDTSHGLLVGRAEFRNIYGSLLDGDLVHCLADAIAHALDVDQNSVRHGIGEDHSFDRAIAYVSESHPDKVLVEATTSVMVKGCIELGLLSRHSGRFILSMSYLHKNETFSHYAFFDAGFEWTRETLERGWIHGRGVLKDNQADVLPSLAEASASITEEAARAFFQKPYVTKMHILTVYELVPRARNSAIPKGVLKVEEPAARSQKEESSTLLCPSCPSSSVITHHHGPAVAHSGLQEKKTAKDFPPGLGSVLWCALNSPEAAQSGVNFLQDLLCAHDAVPPFTMVQKMMEMMKYGPKADGGTAGRGVHFKDPHHTELTTEYLRDLLTASSRLVREDSTALFGPSSWDDIEVLLSQSIAETENMISGVRLSQGLHLAAHGAKLLHLMLTTELQGHDLYSASCVEFDSELFKAMPTVRLISGYGVRRGLKAAVQHMTRCLVMHSRWIMDQGDLDLSRGSNEEISNECCALEAKSCLDSLGSTTCLIAWLFCVEERTKMTELEVVFVIKDAFLGELELSLEDVPEMSERNKDKFVKRLMMYFVLSLGEDFCTQMVVTLGDMLGIADELVLVRPVA